MFQRQYCFTENGGGAHLTSADVYGDEAEAGFLPPVTEAPKEDFYTETAGWIPGGVGECEAESSKTESSKTERCGENDLPALLDTAWGVEMPSVNVPLRFGVRVPSGGRYCVTLEIDGGESGCRNLTIAVGRRNIVERNISIAPHTSYSRSFLFCVHPYRPVVRLEESVLDKQIGISIIGDGARLSACAVAETAAPVLWIGGDSLVRDYEGLYPYNPLMNGGSWGQNLLQYLEGVAVCNQAHSGLTTNCFREDGHWALVAQGLKPGDLFLFEFGHNDQKRRNLNAFLGYAANLRWYVKQVRAQGATPVLVTPMSRIPGYNQGKAYDLLEDYAESMRRVGEELQVPVIDLHTYSFQCFCDMGHAKCQNYFTDTTHVNEYGAAKMAVYIADELKRLQLLPSGAYIRTETYQPWEPDVRLRPKQSRMSAEIEEHPNLSTELACLPYVDCCNLTETEEQTLMQAMAYGLLDPCIRHLHPHAELPRAQFVYMLLKAVEPVEKKAYRGRYCDLSVYEFDAEQIQAALEIGLIDEDLTLDERFCPDAALNEQALYSFAIRAVHDQAERRQNSEQCEQMARSLGWLQEPHRPKRAVSRYEAIAMLVKVCAYRRRRNTI